MRAPRHRLVPATTLLLLPLTLSACADPGGVREDPARPDRATRAASADPVREGSVQDDRGGDDRGAARAAAPREIPGLGPRTRAGVPAASRQAVVVRGDAPDANTSTVTLYERDPGEGWKPVSDPWPAHNALKGWTDHHTQGDLRSPIGVFTLSDAGGLLDDPGTKLPYDQGRAFTATGTGVLGEPLAGSFDYVVAIDYNREPGTTPLDWTRPLGDERGGGIWLHVDHDGPTQGCVSVEKPRMRELLRWLDPAKKPVVVMGDVTSLGR
ncbi:L,D-transpeptidase family protein [Streptomyces sp. NPDC047928]|uniref:L,D-transpeptidase family protein n=1 Tax=unclassified Streptomyces TaxID=2593676 RepID=UPI0037116E28